MSGFKRCSTCGEFKSVSEFGKDSSTKDGLRYSCKPCNRQLASEWQRRNPDRAAARKKDWKDANAEHVRDYFREYDREHSAERKEIKSRYAERNADSIRARKAQRYIDNAEYIKERVREWKRANPHKVAKINFLRRTRMTDNGGSFTLQEWIDLCNKYDNRCVACGSDEYLCVDHVVPVARGGTNDISNIQPLCKSCNLRKGAKTIDYRY